MLYTSITVWSRFEFNFLITISREETVAFLLNVSHLFQVDCPRNLAKSVTVE